MDFTPIQHDSGYLSSSATTSASSVKRVLSFPSESTPSTSRPGSRKRRSEILETKNRKLSDILEDNKDLSPVYSYRSAFFEQSHDSCFNQSSDSSKYSSANDFSFTELDPEKLTYNLEKCSLECPHTPKKIKYDDVPKIKSNSAPGTPQRSDKDSEKESSLRKFYSLDLTPTKKINTKIGTPERLGILYPSIKEVKSPPKVRIELKRHKKPARKRLFHCRDFVYIFSQIHKVEHITFKIFSFLTNTDLVNVSKVSKLWKRSLENDPYSYKRYKTHQKNITIRKENIYVPQAQTKTVKVRNEPCSPSRVNWAKFPRVGAYLSGTQRLTKCLSCAAPAVVDRSLARCSSPLCGFLWCIRCLRGDRSPTRVPCQCSTPHSPPLQNISNTGDAAPSPDSLYYLDKTANTDKNSNSYKPHVLTDCNDNFTRGKTREMKTTLFNIEKHREEIQKAKKTLSRRQIVEPSSPQKTTYAAGSKQSKRNLRRL